MDSPIGYKLDQDQIATLTLNRPESRNALNWEMMELFSETIMQLSKDGQVRALIVHGAGNSFCAGGDLFELHNYSTRADGQRLGALMAQALSNLAALPMPVIAAIEGYAVGGGAEIALACDLRIMAEDARIGFPQIRLALIPVWGGIQRSLNLLGYAQAFHLLSSGDLLDASAAKALGIVTEVVPAGNALLSAKQNAETLLQRDQNALAALKAILSVYARHSFDEAEALEQSQFAALWAAEAHSAAAALFLDSQ
jgi:enoyl-CoA hydratase